MAEPAADDSGEFQAVAESDDDEETVEEGEAPGEMADEDDDTNEENAPSAVDEEMTSAGNGPRQEFKVMSWAELIGKLHRPN